MWSPKRKAISMFLFFAVLVVILNGLPDQPVDDRVREDPLYQLGQEMRAAAERLPRNPDFEDSFILSTLPRFVGSMLAPWIVASIFFAFLAISKKKRKADVFYNLLFAMCILFSVTFSIRKLGAFL